MNIRVASIFRWRVRIILTVIIDVFTYYRSISIFPTYSCTSKVVLSYYYPYIVPIVFVYVFRTRPACVSNAFWRRLLRSTTVVEVRTYAKTRVLPFIETPYNTWYNIHLNSDTERKKKNHDFVIDER